jgi:hypothetical protein
MRDVPAAELLRIAVGKIKHGATVRQGLSRAIALDAMDWGHLDAAVVLIEAVIQAQLVPVTPVAPAMGVAAE